MLRKTVSYGHEIRQMDKSARHQELEPSVTEFYQTTEIEL
jgi:hypothetical protein